MDKCIDPKYQIDLMGASTYYPQGTICFKDPSSGIYIRLFLCIDQGKDNRVCFC